MELNLADCLAVNRFAVDCRCRRRFDNPVVAAVIAKIRRIALQSSGVENCNRIIDLLLDIWIFIVDFRFHTVTGLCSGLGAVVLLPGRRRFGADDFHHNRLAR